MIAAGDAVAPTSGKTGKHQPAARAILLDKDILFTPAFPQLSCDLRQIDSDSEWTFARKNRLSRCDSGQQKGGPHHQCDTRLND